MEMTISFLWEVKCAAGCIRVYFLLKCLASNIGAFMRYNTLWICCMHIFFYKICRGIDNNQPCIHVDNKFVNTAKFPRLIAAGKSIPFESVSLVLAPPTVKWKSCFRLQGDKPLTNKTRAWIAITASLTKLRCKTIVLVIALTIILPLLYTPNRRICVIMQVFSCSYHCTSSVMSHINESIFTEEIWWYYPCP